MSGYLKLVWDKIFLGNFWCLPSLHRNTLACRKMSTLIGHNNLSVALYVSMIPIMTSRSVLQENTSSGSGQGQFMLLQNVQFPIKVFQWWRYLFRCRIDLLNFSMGFNIIAPYMEFLHLNWYIAEWFSMTLLSSPEQLFATIFNQDSLDQCLVPINSDRYYGIDVKFFSM